MMKLCDEIIRNMIMLGCEQDTRGSCAVAWPQGAGEAGAALMCIAAHLGAAAVRVDALLTARADAAEARRAAGAGRRQRARGTA